METKAIDDASRTDGGCAFPFVSHGGVNEHQYIDSGMSLRAYFAGQAIVGLLAFPHSHRDTRIDTFAENAVAYADALLAALGRALNIGDTE